MIVIFIFFFFSSRRRHTRLQGDWSSDVCSSDLAGLFADYGYGNMRLPLVEATALFSRSIGEATDIVEKEMYTFPDRNGDSLTLRPEATAGIVRAAIEHSLLYDGPKKAWTGGPMFRYERPQKGRYRQFHQIDVEALGFAGPDVDAEQIVMLARLWKQVGIADVELHINSIGDARSEERRVGKECRSRWSPYH